MKKTYVAICLLLTVACTAISKTKDVRVPNTDNEDLFIRVEGTDNAAYHKLAVMQHGLASNKEHQAIQAAKKAFLKNKYVVITFDNRYSLGEGNNEVERVRLATFEDDLQTVIAWAQKQPFYHEPFALAGHSLGGATVLEFGAAHPEQVDILVPITPLISGKKWETSCLKNMTAFCKSWKQNGSFEYTDPHNQKTGHIPYAVVTSTKNYNAFAFAPKITAKTLLIAAQNDNIINAPDVQKLSAKMKNAQAVTIANSGHNFEEQQNQADLYRAIDTFLKQ